MSTVNKYVRHARPLVSDVEYDRRAIITVGKNRRGTDGRTDERQTVTSRLPLDAPSVINDNRQEVKAKARHKKQQ